MPYFLYILYSKNLDKYYVGVSANIEEPLQRHLSNHKGFTSRAKDWQIVYFEKYENRLLALKREKRIKNWKSRTMIEKLIDEK
ncbi:GIY-YIG nuclease family protein [Polaribacter sp. R77954]|uniref:GIY-YIG nuclease family protein n=1 Tax=Polaribacter sp. R77954 TaxID=3093870 RepID=UPI0037C7F2AD